MTKSLITIGCFFCAIPFFAQNSLVITPGAQVTVTGNVPITLQNMHFINNGTFTAGGGTIVMNGNSVTSIGGTGAIDFFNLLVNNSAGLNLAQNIGVANELDVRGPVNVKNYSVTLGNSAAILNESEVNRLTDDAGNTGNLITSRNFTGSVTNNNPANLGVALVNAPALGITTITRYVTAYVRNGSSAGLINRYYNIQAANNTGLNASVRLYYLDAELNGVDENTAVLWKSTNNGISWSQLLPDSRNTTVNYLQKDNLDDFGLITIGTINSALPVVISAYNTTCNDNGALLVWTTQLEDGSKEFVIEKSKEGNQWTTIGVINARGIASNYHFTDAEAGIAFYRLKQVDKDGSFTYSKILKSTCDIKSITLLLYPNPANSFTDLVFKSPRAFTTTLRLFNNAGQLVKAINTNVQAGANTIRINLSGLARGTYLIKLDDSSLNIHKIVIKQ
jgi:Secretion system C-terminal sorting domain